ncbi:MAG TPA: hypothetical protein VMI31_05045 [Fimbriimonadaceae bacterium]|nr:hypothetical protein [Fimbriimonadaceae bacterium]
MLRYRLIGFAVGFLLAVAIAGWIGRWRTTPPRVLPESNGEIATVEIQYTRAAAPDAWPCLKSFLTQLPTSVELIAVCGDEADAATFRKAARELPPRKTEVVVVGTPITGWSKDRFLVAQGRETELVCPAAWPSPLPDRVNDAKVARAIARQWPDRFETTQADLVFDAGDILCADTKVLVNDELRAKNPLAADWLSRVATITGRAPVWLKGSPGHHIGMFAAPLGDHTVVVGDPDLGQKLWKPEMAKLLGRADFTLATTEPFRRAIADLQQAGFEVVRTPLIPIEPKVYVTYTNGIFEVRGGEATVYMPSYGVPALDQAASQAYASAGLNVHPVAVRSVFRCCGTIGCLVNVLDRD